MRGTVNITNDWIQRLYYNLNGDYYEQRKRFRAKND